VENNFRLELRTIFELCNDYPEIYKSVFNDFATEGNCPSEVYLGYKDDKLIGFMAGYIQSNNTWYLQRGGFKVENQRKVDNLHLFNKALDIIHDKWLHIIAMIQNNDTTALKMALMGKFKIIGTRMDTANNLWVEMIHTREV
jgi:hypothetical protein